jgi:hypothetical protein
LALNHGTDDNPSFFETALLNGDCEIVDRYPTYEDACEGHEYQVALLLMQDLPEGSGDDEEDTFMTLKEARDLFKVQ